MKQFMNHIDHIAWLAYFENIERYAQQLSELCGVKLLGPYMREDMGICIYISPRGGLEIIAALDHVETPFNAVLKEQLRSRGEGVAAVIFGVPDLDEAMDHARTLGYAPGEVVSIDSYPAAGPPPWVSHYEVLKESVIASFMNTTLLFGEVVHADGVIQTQKKVAAEAAGA